MNKIYFLIILFFLNACSIKTYEANTKSVMINFNSPLVRIQDAGFLEQNGKMTYLEVYKLGQAFFRIKIEDKICLNEICYDKKLFNKKFFKNSFYDDFLEDILKNKPLFNAKNLQKQDCGFKQSIKGLDYDIIYEVCNNQTFFLDKLNKTKITIQKLD
ncbi:hypothetical protein JG677_03800 [Campylobacter sp. TTU-622]|uniref:hypothetical protein n=1 Tax=Campylobacter sp. TTU-622 TaxID=2800583 RepID=UPI0019069278|nr:hypothetical protein [Campylobacter sp. TTU-622]MBK1973174.1 hypothetical protein [Campylobacter sp. TTU-622]